MSDGRIAFGKLGKVRGADPFFGIPAVCADIAKDFYAGKNGHANRNVVSRSISPGVTVYFQNSGAVTFGAGS